MDARIAAALRILVMVAVSSDTPTDSSDAIYEAVELLDLALSDMDRKAMYDKGRN